LKFSILWVNARARCRDVHAAGRPSNQSEAGLAGVGIPGPPTRKYRPLVPRVNNIVTTLFFDAMGREAKGLLPRNIFIITRRYKMVEIQQ